MLALRDKLAADIAALTRQAEAEAAEDAPERQALPAELARREALKEKLDAGLRKAGGEGPRRPCGGEGGPCPATRGL